MEKSSLNGRCFSRWFDWRVEAVGNVRQLIEDLLAVQLQDSGRAIHDAQGLVLVSGLRLLDCLLLRLQESPIVQPRERPASRSAAEECPPSAAALAASPVAAAPGPKIILHMRE